MNIYIIYDCEVMEKVFIFLITLSEFIIIVVKYCCYLLSLVLLCNLIYIYTAILFKQTTYPNFMLSLLYFIIHLKIRYLNLNGEL